MFKFSLKILIVSVLILVASSAHAYYELDKPTGFVSDFAGILSTEEKSSLENKLLQFEQETSNEISVVTIESLDGDFIENFAVKLFEDWGIGKADKDNGILLLIALQDRKMRIEVGYGLEGALTDVQSSRIIKNTLTPSFQREDYHGGINTALDQVIATTKGEYEPTNNIMSNISGRSLESIFWLIIFIFYALIALKRHLAKSKAWWEGGLFGVAIGALISAIFFSLAYIIFFAIGFAVFGLVFDFMVSRFKIFANKPLKKGRNNLWFFGGPRGGRGGGGFGGFGGGFSGGGGSSGGW